MSFALHAQSVYVPLNHWAYDFVERLEAKGLIRGALNATKPYSREEMTGYLLQAESKLRAGTRMSETAQEQLQFLRFEFKEEFEQLTGSNGHHYVSKLHKIKDSRIIGKAFPGFVYRNGRNLFSVQEPGFKLFADPVFYHKLEYANPDSIAHTDRVFERTHGFQLWGQLGSHMGFFFDFRDTKEWGSRAYPSEFDISLQGLGFVNGYGSHIWHDETLAYLVFKLPYVQVMFGKDSNYWGPGFNGTLGLSDNATSYDQLKLQARFWRLKFTYVWGFLRSFPPVFDETGGSRPKNIVAHRLDLDVAKWLDVGLYETVIFSNRRFELAYANPINFYRSAEHFLSDDDNATMGVDVELFVIPNVKLYGELFIDDLFTSKLGSGWFGNKTAYIIGGYWVDPVNLFNLDLRLEYARTRPFLYTHITDLNAYTHFSTGLGHWIGPNSDNLFLQMKYRFSKSLLVAADFESFRHGANDPETNFGGDILHPRETGDSDTFDFLGGNRERVNRIGFRINYEVYRNFYLGLNVSKSSAENVLIPAGTRGPVRRNEIALNLSLNR